MILPLFLRKTMTTVLLALMMKKGICCLLLFSSCYCYIGHYLPSQIWHSVNNLSLKLPLEVPFRHLLKSKGVLKPSYSVSAWIWEKFRMSSLWEEKYCNVISMELYFSRAKWQVCFHMVLNPNPYPFSNVTDKYKQRSILIYSYYLKVK